MPELLKHWPSPERQNWALLLNGNIYLCERGTDFLSSTVAFRRLALKQARKRGIRLRTVIVSDDAIALQALGDAGARKAEYIVWDRERLQQMVDLWRAGKTADEIGRALGVSGGNIGATMSAARRAGLPVPKRRRGGPDWRMEWVGYDGKLASEPLGPAERITAADVERFRAVRREASRSAGGAA